jgi:hypothetical protein
MTGSLDVEIDAGGRSMAMGGYLAAATLGWMLAYALNGRLQDWVLFDGLGLEPGSQLGEAVNFFFYDRSRSCCCSPGSSLWLPSSVAS